MASTRIAGSIHAQILHCCTSVKFHLHQLPFIKNCNLYRFLCPPVITHMWFLYCFVCLNLLNVLELLWPCCFQVSVSLPMCSYLLDKLLVDDPLYYTCDACKYEDNIVMPYDLYFRNSNSIHIPLTFKGRRICKKFLSIK